MAWGSLSGGQMSTVLVELKLLGATAYAAGMARATTATTRLGTAVNAQTARFWQSTAAANRLTGATQRLAASQALLARNTAIATKRSYIQNQVLFTGRRLLFYMTLGTLAAGAAVVAMGFSFQNTMQQATVALRPLFSSTQALNEELNKLFALAAGTPFQFQDMVLGFTQMLKAGDLGVAKVNELIAAVADMLAATPGRATAANLNRVTTALSHMINLGRPTGQVILQLARLGIPIEKILVKQLGVTEQQLKSIAKSGLTSVQVMDALIKASKTMPEFRGQALASQLGTFTGAISTLKDFLAQASGQGTSGVFSGLFKVFQNVDKQLIAIGKTGKPVTLTTIVEAFDKELTPKTHGLIKAFVLLTSALQTVIGVFVGLATAISFLLYISGFDKLFDIANHNKVAMQALGIITGILISLWIIGRIKALAYTVALEIAEVVTWANARADMAFAFAQTLAGYAMVFARWAAIRLVTWLVAAKIATILWTDELMKLTIWLQTSSAAALTNPLTAIIVAVLALTVGLVILYYKWQAFHDFVDKTYHFLQEHPFAALLIPIYGPIIYAVVAVQRLWDWLMRIWNLLKNVFTLHINIKVDKPGLFDMLKKAAQVTAQVTDPLGIQRAALRRVTGGRTGFLGRSPVGMQQGGTIVRPGLAMVGEGGPEIVTLPAGASVIPLSGLGAPAGGNLGLPEVLNLKAILRVDGRDLAEVVAQHRLNRQARR
jgi:tape measure domain-containing protein